MVGGGGGGGSRSKKVEFEADPRIPLLARPSLPALGVSSKYIARNLCNFLARKSANGRQHPPSLLPRAGGHARQAGCGVGEILRSAASAAPSRLCCTAGLA